MPIWCTTSCLLPKSLLLVVAFVCFVGCHDSTGSSISAHLNNTLPEVAAQGFGFEAESSNANFSSKFTAWFGNASVELYDWLPAIIAAGLFLIAALAAGFSLLKRLVYGNAYVSITEMPSTPRWLNNSYATIMEMTKSTSAAASEQPSTGDKQNRVLHSTLLSCKHDNKADVCV